MPSYNFWANWVVWAIEKPNCDLASKSNKEVVRGDLGKIHFSSSLLLISWKSVPSFLIVSSALANS
jgi:hypothetical protein